jgi:phage shock protein C
MSVSDELGKLGDLHQKGVLSDEEFARAKAKVLSGSASAAAGPLPTYGGSNLQRSLNDRWLGGVCGGIAQVTDVPSWVWRLIFILAVLMAGTGLLMYILLWILMPQERLALPAPTGPSTPSY